jgi:3-oxoacyl-[acyl-carrier protein] reductase
MLSGPGEQENPSNVPVYPDLASKVAVVTGGSGGIGAATCRLLAANGAKVAVNGRDGTRIDAVLDAIRSAGGEALGVAADCTDLAAIERMRRRVEEEFGPPDVVVAFAGGRAPDRWSRPRRRSGIRPSMLTSPPLSSPSRASYQP